jgi:hypothetical protein
MEYLPKYDLNIWIEGWDPNKIKASTAHISLKLNH